MNDQAESVDDALARARKALLDFMEASDYTAPFTEPARLVAEFEQAIGRSEAPQDETASEARNAMLRELMEAMGESMHARPQTPESVWREMLAKVRALHNEVEVGEGERLQAQYAMRGEILAVAIEQRDAAYTERTRLAVALARLLGTSTASPQ